MFKMYISFSCERNLGVISVSWLVTHIYKCSRVSRNWQVGPACVNAIWRGNWKMCC